MRKMVAGALTALFLLGGAYGASAAKPTAGEEPRNTHGICTAYFNGQKNGHDRNGQPGPFDALAAAADPDPSDDQPATLQDVFDYCDRSSKGIGGNPDENGRYTDCFTNTNDDSTDDCTDG